MSQFPFGNQLNSEGELPNLTGDWDGGVPENFNLTCKGIVSPRKGHADGGHGSMTYDGFGYHISFGKGQLSNNIAPVYAVYRFKRVN